MRAATSVSPQNGVTLQKLAAAGIPIRVRSVGASMHWKFMLFFGQQTLEFGAANFSTEYFIPVQAVQELHGRSDLLHRRSADRRFVQDAHGRRLDGYGAALELRERPHAAGAGEWNISHQPGPPVRTVAELRLARRPAI